MKKGKKMVRPGIDLGKNNLHLAGVDKGGTPIIKKKLSRNKYGTFLISKFSQLARFSREPPRERTDRLLVSLAGLATVAILLRAVPWPVPLGAIRRP